ncbi:MAG: hypothetical protein EBR01_06945 [Proteobacteria bacterium]|nr:hypothetical protein [Pseudomonadota bacterium]
MPIELKKFLGDARKGAVKSTLKVIRDYPFSFFLLIAGFLNALLTFYPGSMSPDSYDQLRQALTNHYNDWHPPVMAWFWRQLLWIKKGPQPMLFFHLGMFWGGLFLIWKQLAEKKSWCRVLVPLIGVFPPIIGIIGVIWKDIGVGAALLMTVGLWSSLQSHFKVKFVLILILLTYATWARHQSLALTIPFFLAIPWLPQISNRLELKRLSKYRFLIGCFLVVLVVASNRVFESFFLKAKPNYVVTTLYLVDLSKIEQETHLKLLPEAFKTKNYNQEKVFRLINERYLGHLFFPADAALRISPEQTAREELKKIWISNIIKYFRHYAKFRWFHFRSIMSIGFRPVYINHFYMPKDFGGGLEFMVAWRVYLNHLTGRWSVNTPFFYGWFYMLVSIAGIVLSLIVKGIYISRARLCFVSSLLYSLSYLPVGGIDFRYIWPIIVMTCVGVVLLLSSLKIPSRLEYVK